jgi:hypothetical protein
MSHPLPRASRIFCLSMPMTAKVVIDANDRFMGGDVAGASFLVVVVLVPSSDVRLDIRAGHPGKQPRSPIETSEFLRQHFF